MDHADLFAIRRSRGAAAYWEARARRFAGRDAGLRAVCSCGMPDLYNAAIALTQRRALAPFLRPSPGASVLDAGCGVGRWSRRLAAAGARVTGVDLSPTMVAEARRRADAEGLGARCRFLVGDLAELDALEGLEAGEAFDQVIGVTVLQHLLEPERLERAIAGLARRLLPGGRAVLLEAAPERPDQRNDSAVFAARSAPVYRRYFAAAGLEIETERGVDPAPFRRLLLPLLPAFPRPVARAATALASLLSLPVDLLGAPFLRSVSWHRVFVLRRPRDAS